MTAATSNLFHFIVATLITAGSVAGAAIIDDFTNDALSSEWVYTETLRQGGATAVITYDTTTNDNSLTYSFTTPNAGAVQTTLMRDDVTLGVGEYVQVQVTLNESGGITNAGSLFGGLYLDRVSEVATEPTFAGLALDLLGDGQVIRQVGPAGTNTAIIGDRTNVSLRLSRLTPNAVQGTYSTDGVNFALIGNPITVTDVAAVGFLNGNARSSQAGTVQFDDFEISTEQAQFTPLVNVDFNSSTAHASGVGPTQATDSFFGFNADNGLSQVFNGVTVAIDTNAGRNRAPTGLSGSYADLYTDFLLASTLSLSGLSANTPYVITFQSWDTAVSGPETSIFTDTTASGITNGVTGTITFGTTFGDPSNSLGTDFSATSLLVVSNGSGVLTFSITGSEGRLNGFELYQLAAVPEPGSMSLFGLGAAIAIAKRRRRMVRLPDGRK